MINLINFNDFTKKKKKKKNNPNWLQNPGRPYRILIIGGSGSRKTNSLI